MSDLICRQCTGRMDEGIAIPIAYQCDIDERVISGASWSGVAPIVTVWKCRMCGHSVLKEKKEKLMSTNEFTESFRFWLLISWAIAATLSGVGMGVAVIVYLIRISLGY